MAMIQVCLVAIASVLLISLIRSYKPEFTVLAVLGSSIVLLLLLLESVTNSFTHLVTLYENLSYGKTYFPVILKSLAIAYLTEFTSAICRDAGEKSIA